MRGIPTRKQENSMGHRALSLQEQQALANDLLSKPEGCQAWEPIPSRFPGIWQVDVTHVAEDYGTDRRPGENLTIAVAASTALSDPMPRDVGAWRIDFTSCAAYRERITNYVGATPLTRPDTPTAFWEITGSHFLVESGVWAAYRMYNYGEFHHYVIISAMHTVHEVLAYGWRATPLPAAWAKMLTRPMPPWPPRAA